MSLDEAKVNVVRSCFPLIHVSISATRTILLPPASIQEPQVDLRCVAKFIGSSNSEVVDDTLDCFHVFVCLILP
jgi:hypothetical protein